MNKWTLFLCAVLLSSTAMAGEEIDKTLAADADGEVLVSNIAGTVVIHGWNKKEVRVTGELGKGTKELVFDRDGSKIVIKVEIGKNQNHNQGRHHRVDDTDLEIWLPQLSEIEVVTVSADIETDEVRGNQHLRSVSGEVVTQIWSEDLKIQSVSGDATVIGHGPAGVVMVNVVSGDAEIENVSGEVEVQSVSGDLVLELGDIKSARVRSTTGDMELSGRLLKGADVEVESINGDATLVFEGAVHAEIEIETFNGEIDNCFGPEARRTSKYAPGRELSFTEGDGSGEISIETLNGDVTLCKD